MQAEQYIQIIRWILPFCNLIALYHLVPIRCFALQATPLTLTVSYDHVLSLASRMFTTINYLLLMFKFCEMMVLFLFTPRHDCQ